MSSTTFNIVICGGGYAGIQTALELDRLLLSSHDLISSRYKIDIKITILDKSDSHVLLPSLPEVILNRGFYSIPYRDIFTKKMKVKFIRATIQMIDLEKKTVKIIPHSTKDDINNKNNPISISYDVLVLALGSRPFLPSIPGLSEFAYQFNSLEDVKKIVKRLVELSKLAVSGLGSPLTIVIAGGGATGAEVTGEIATYFERIMSRTRNDNNNSSNRARIKIILVSTSLLEGFPERARSWAKNYLQVMGVEMKIGPGYKVSKVEEKSVMLQNGQRIAMDMFIWTGGVTASFLPKEAGLRTGFRDRVIVNRYLQTIGRSNVFAVGDCALIADDQGNNVLPTSAQFAEQQGRIAARNIHALILGKDMKKYIPTVEGFAVSIGPTFAVARLGTLDQYGTNASSIKKIIKMKYLKEIAGLSAAISEYVSPEF